MPLTRFEVLEVDATVIIGLLILLTFQSFSSSGVENEINRYFDDLYNTFIELQKTKDVLLVCNEYRDDPQELRPEVISKFQTRCDELEIKSLELTTELNTLHEWGKYRGYVDENFLYTEFVTSLHLGAFNMNLINFMMITPFVVSAVIESIIAFRKKEDEDKASKGGIISMVAGFIMIIVGFILILAFFSYGAFT